MNSTRIVFLSLLCLIIRYSLTVWQSIQKRSPKDKKQLRFLSNGQIHIWQQNHDEMVLIKSFLSDQHQLYDVIILPWVTKLQRRLLHPRQKSFRRYAAWNLRMHRLLRVPSLGWSWLLSWQFSHFVPFSLFSYFDRISSLILYWQYKKKVYLLLEHCFLLKNRI